MMPYTTDSNKTLLDQNTYLHTTVPFCFKFSK